MKSKRQDPSPFCCPHCGNPRLKGTYSGWYVQTAANVAKQTYDLKTWEACGAAEEDLASPEHLAEFLDDGVARPLSTCRCICEACEKAVDFTETELREMVDASTRQRASRQPRGGSNAKLRPLRVDDIEVATTAPRSDFSPEWATCPRCLDATMSLLMYLPRERSESGKARGTIFTDADGIALDIDDGNPGSIEESFDTSAASFGLQCTRGCSDPFLLLGPDHCDFRGPGSAVFTYPGAPSTIGPTLLDLVSSGLYANALLCLAINPDCMGGRLRRLILARIEWELPFHGVHRVAYESMPTSQPSRDIAETRHFDCVSDQLKRGSKWHIGQYQSKSRGAIQAAALAASRLDKVTRWASDLPEFDADFGAGLEFHGPFTIAWRAGKPSDCMTPQEAALLVRRDLPDRLAIDLFDVRHLTPDTAAILADFQGKCHEYVQTDDEGWAIEDCNPGLCMDRLGTLTPAAAEALARGSTPSLSLRGLRHASSEVIAMLRRFRGNLFLPDFAR
jgi:hypothetical protein